jgi:hypothetical protein
LQRQAISLEGKLYQQADLRNSIYNEVNADLSRRCENSLDLAALVALHSVTLLFERASHRDLEIFRIFEAAISILVCYTIYFPCGKANIHKLGREIDNVIQILSRKGISSSR